MKIHVTLFGALLRNQRESQFTLEVVPGTTVRAVVFGALGFLEKHERYFVCLLNEEQVALDTEVHDADKLKVLLPVGGG